MTTADQKLKSTFKVMIDTLDLAGSHGAKIYAEIAPQMLYSMVSEADPEVAYRVIRPVYAKKLGLLFGSVPLGPREGDLVYRVIKAVDNSQNLNDAFTVLSAIDLSDDDTDRGE